MTLNNEPIVEEVEIRELSATNASSSPLLLLINSDSSSVYVRSWGVMTRKLATYPLSIGRLTLKDFKMDEEIMQFFASVNPICFSSTVVSCDNVDFSAVPSCFQQLLRNYLSRKLSNSEAFVALPSVDCLHFLGLVHPAAGLKIDFSGILQFLQSKDVVAGRKEIFLDHFCLNLGIEEIWHQLYQIFVTDTNRSNYKLAIKCSEGTLLPRERRFQNAQTEELLTLQLHQTNRNPSMNQHWVPCETYVIFSRVFSPILPPLVKSQAN
uniref:BTB domain-containing protein n=1 Tax=Ditylenchus dipsaci TaxID=166011 RepID=A0A915DK94_9BILA